MTPLSPPKGKAPPPARLGRPTLRFLSGLARNNERRWFEAHRPAYEHDVRDAAVHFVEDMLPRVQKLSPHYTGEAKPIGGSIMRIHRDIRFSKDKTPYKTNIGIHFWHKQGTESRLAPVFYVHVAPKETFAGGGLYGLGAPDALKVRKAIAAEPQRWLRAARPVTMDGDQLKHVPKPWAEDHPAAADLRRKEWLWSVPLKASDVGPRFQDKCFEGFQRGAPVMDFLCGALGFPF